MVLLTPMVVYPPARAMFLLPKSALFFTGSILLALVAAAAVTGGELRILQARNFQIAHALTGVVLVWTAVATAFSTKASLSVGALAVAAGYAMFFLSALHLLRQRTVAALFPLFAAAAANAALVILQESGIWQPFDLQDFRYDPHLASTGLMGNPNGVGMLLMGAALAAVALALESRGRLRWTTGALAILLVGGILASRTLTAAVGFAAGTAVLLLLVSWKRAVVALAIALAFAMTAVVVHPPIRGRVAHLAELARSGDYNTLLTNRLTPFTAAVDLAREHPLTGTGPGTFGWHYFDAKIGAEQRHPSLRGPHQQGSWNYSFSEVHNDHLEVLAETGVPGYLIFLGCLGWLGSLSLRRRSPEPMELEQEFARVLSLPLATGFAVLTLAQFPLQMPAAALSYLFLAAACVRWSGAYPPAGEVKAARWSAGRLIAVGAVVLIAIAAVNHAAIRPLRCDVTLKDLERRTNSNLAARPLLAAPAARETIVETDRLLARCPFSQELLMVRAANLRLVDRRDEAVETYRRALAIEKRPEILFQLGATLLETGRTQEALAAFTEACRFQPLLLEHVPFAVRGEVIEGIR
jgi:O-antigen ligase